MAKYAAPSAFKRLPDGCPTDSLASRRAFR